MDETPQSVTVVIPPEAIQTTTQVQMVMAKLEEQTPEPQQEINNEIQMPDPQNAGQLPQIDLENPIQKSGELKPQRDEKGHFLPGNQESITPLNTGRPCEFCQRPVEIMNKVHLYREWCRGNVDGKIHIPYIEELISEDYLDITIDQFKSWMNNPTHPELHTEFCTTVLKLQNRQKLNLLKVTLTDHYRGAMFQLSANHGMMEQSKNYQGGIKGGEPMEYNIHIVPKKKVEELNE